MQITEEYEIGEIIGHGASCTVRRAIKRENGEEFAIKVYDSQRLKAKNQIDMLIRLEHPCIVNIFDVYEDDDSITLVLEYMVGGELYNMVGNKTKFSQTQVREYMKSIVDAVRYCHELGIVHRDIKVCFCLKQPQNLLMSTKGPDAMLKLADFGISKILSEEMLNTNCGTPIYMAPQIWQGHPYNQKVDVWSMGVVMFYLLTGNHPFDGDSSSLIENITTYEIEFSEEMWNTVSSKAINLLRSLLSKDPQKRPSAKEVANHLWLNHIDTIPKQIFDVEEVNLIKAVRKIKRNIMKERLKKNIKMMKDLLSKQKVSRHRMKFLLIESQMSVTTQEQGMDIQFGY